VQKDSYCFSIQQQVEPFCLHPLIFTLYPLSFPLTTCLVSATGPQ